MSEAVPKQGYGYSVGMMTVFFQLMSILLP